MSQRLGSHAEIFSIYDQQIELNSCQIKSFELRLLTCLTSLSISPDIPHDPGKIKHIFEMNRQIEQLWLGN